MSQKLPVSNFEQIEETFQFNDDFIKNYYDESEEGYVPKFDLQHPKKFQELHNDLPFLSERMKIEKVEKVVANLHDKTEYVVHGRNLKQTLNHELILFN